MYPPYPGVAIQSEPISRNQAHSQPILPSQRSRHFYNGHLPASQNQIRLPQPPPCRSPAPIVTPGGSMRPPLARLPTQLQRQSFFDSRPAAMGYLPQQPRKYERNPSLHGPIMPLREQFYFNDNPPMTNSQAHLKPLSTKSPSPKVAPGAMQLASQHLTKKSTSSDKTGLREKSLVSHSKGLNKPANGNEQGLNKRSNDACATDGETSARPIKIRFVNRHTSDSIDSSQQAQDVPNTSPSTSTFTQVDKHASQGYRPSQILLQTLEGNSTSESLDPVIGTMSTSSTHTELSQARGLSRLSTIKADREIGARAPSATSVPTLGNLQHPPIDPPSPSPQDQLSISQIMSQLLTQSPPTRDECIQSHAQTPRVRRSASQATTVSGTSTQPSCATENEDVPEVEDVFNPMSMIDETLVLDRDLSEIVNTRLQEGKPELLDALYGEILIKMALRDEELYGAVSKILTS